MKIITLKAICQTCKTVFEHISNTEKRVENTTHNRVFLTNFKVFGNVLKQERPCLSTFSNNEKRIENTTRSEVVLMNIDVFGNVIKHDLECLIYLFNRNQN